jgi:replicative DNA helicase
VFIAADRNYRLEDIPPDERGIAEIHIAKHRNGPTGMVKVAFNENFASFRNLETQIKMQSAAAPTLKPKSAFVKQNNSPEY